MLVLQLFVVLFVFIVNSSASTNNYYPRSQSSNSQFNPYDCATYPSNELLNTHEVHSHLTQSLAVKVAAKAFKDQVFLPMLHHAVWQGPTKNQWTNTQPGATCATEVPLLFEVDPNNANPLLIGEGCRISIHQGTDTYMHHLTVCKKNAAFLYKHHCEACATVQDIQQWVHYFFSPHERTPYVLMGPIADFHFYEEEDYSEEENHTYGTHSRMLVAFVKNRVVYLFPKARLLFNGYTGIIHKLDLSHNKNYKNGVTAGMFDPDYPPNFKSIIAFIPPEPEELYPLIVQ